MYAVVRTGGKQYKMAVNDVLRIEKLPGAEGDAIQFDDVLLVSAQDGIATGSAVEQSQVTATILRQFRDKKVLVFKKKRRKNYRWSHGHRQSLTEVRVTEIRP
ncbi:MAG: 50S ribosomal protein L21 [Magnetococcus sp. YQC-5]